MIKLSIIVPIYGVEQYLRKCVDSILAQNIPSTEYEIILVDDGSPDACPQICDEYAERAKSQELRAKSVPIRVIHRENGGLSAARNSGIEIAKGKYVAFLDSDDYWEPNVLKGLLEQMERDQLDVLRFRFQNVRIKNEGVREEREYEVFQPNKRDYRLENDYSDKPTDGVTFLNTRMGTQCYVAMFIIKRELLDGCLFTPGIYFEDTDWTPRMLVKAKRVASTDTIVYNYLIRQGSITNAVEYNKKKKVLDDKMRLVETMQRQSQELNEQWKDNQWFSKMIADTVISIITIIAVQFYKDRDSYLRRLKELDIYPIQSRHYKARLINLSPRLTVAFLHLKNS